MYVNLNIKLFLTPNIIQKNHLFCITWTDNTKHLTQCYITWHESGNNQGKTQNVLT